MLLCPLLCVWSHNTSTLPTSGNSALAGPAAIASPLSGVASPLRRPRATFPVLWGRSGTQHDCFSERPSLNTTDSCLEFTCSAGQSNQQQKNEWAQESLLSAGSLRVWVSGLPFVLRICSETRQEHKQKHTGILMGILTTSLFLSWVYISSALIF